MAKQKPEVVAIPTEPIFYRTPERSWNVCKECNEPVFREATGKEYYHRIVCSKSNGVVYKKDRHE